MNDIQIGEAASSASSASSTWSGSWRSVVSAGMRPRRTPSSART